MVNRNKPYEKIAEALRFVRDTKNENSEVLPEDQSGYLNFYLRNGLLVNKSSTPIIEDALIKTCGKLYFPREKINAFVFASPDIQASCLSVSNQECIIKLSSALVNILDKEELSFVLGHELGHHILGHSSNKPNDESLEGFVNQRAQEISVDRIGLYCCGDLKSSMTSIIKTISGLNNHHLRFNVGQFISQLSKASKSGYFEDVRNSHPSFLFRAKALLLFFDQKSFDQISNLEFSTLDITKLNSRVEKELDSLVEAPILDYKNKICTDYKMWILMKLILSDGTISKIEQKLFASEFGQENLQKFIRLASNYEKNEVTKIINRNRQNAVSLIQKSFPESCDKLIANLTEEISCLFK